MFKFPLPNDFRNHCEDFTGKDLSWFFDGVLGSTQKMDYKLVGIKKDSLIVKNKTGFVAPIIVSDNNNKTLLIEGFKGTKNIEYRISNNEHQNIFIDKKTSSIDLYRQNNSLKKPISIRFLPALENPNKRQIFCIPLYAWNNYNHSMLGVHLSNDVFPMPKNEISFTPLYSFTTNDWNGYLNLAKNIFPAKDGTYKKVKIGVNMSRFATIGLVQKGFRLNGIETDYFMNSTYEKFEPYIELHFNQKTERSLFSNVLKMRHVTILENPQNSGYFNNWDNQSISAFDIKHHFKHDLKTFPSSANVNLQIGTINYTFGRISADFTQGILYKDKGKTATVRLFAGTFLGSRSNNNYTDFSQSRSYFRAGGTTGQFDYLYDETMFGRAEQNQQQTWMARQIINRDAGFRNFVNIGSSSTWLTSANLTIPFPFKLPIGVYSDVVFWEELSSTSGVNSFKTSITYSGGLYLSIAKNIFQLYLPLFASKDVLDAWESSNLNHPFERASFILNLNALNPVKIIKEAKL